MRLRLIAALLLLAFGCKPLQAQSVLEDIQRSVSAFSDANSFSGTVLVADSTGPVYLESFGLADRSSGQANEHSTAYFLASTSRVFTSAAVMLLEQQGQLSVEDPLSVHLPDWPNGDRITIHHLLTLSAGLPDINGLGFHWWWERRNQTASSLAEKFRELPLVYEPGSRTEHSNSNYVVLALLVEEISGRSFGDFLEEAFFGPLGMTRSGHFSGSDMTIEGLARGYQPEGVDGLENARYINWSAKTGHASIFSSAPDILRFDQSLRSGEILGRSSTERLFLEHFPSNGYGWFLRNTDDGRFAYITGRSPGYGTFWGRSLTSNHTVILLGNYYGSTVVTLGHQLMAIVTGDSLSHPRPENRPIPAGLAAELSGRYDFGPDFYRPDGSVTVRADRRGNLWAGDARLLPSQSRMVFLHRQYGSILEFVRDEQGVVVGLLYDGFRGVRRD